MAKLDLTVESIKDLMLSFNRCGLSKLEIEDSGFKLSFSKEQSICAAQPNTQTVVQPIVQAVVSPAANTSLEQDPAEEHKGTPVVSPIVGTYYSASSPDKAPFVKVGQSVKKGDVLFIIESMKLMNEITSEADGTVLEICTENGTAVEYGQPIMYIG